MLIQEQRRKRTAKGAALAEFGAAFVLLVVFFFIPLVNMSFIGVRFFIAQGAIQEFAHRLAMAEKRSDSYSMLAADSFWSDFCKNCGVDISGSHLQLVLCAANSPDQLRLDQFQKVPAEWLPGGAKAPCIYTYDLKVDIKIPAIYSGGGPDIPALTRPVQVSLNGRSAWENLSRNPASMEYFINE